MKSAKKIRVGVVGCGLIGKRRAKVVSENPESELIYLADANSEAAQKTAQSCGAAWSTDWKKVVSAPDIDCVIVSTPNHLLMPVALEAMKRGKHVLIEKPMGRNAAEALKMKNAAAKYKKKLKIGFNHRYHPAIMKAYNLFARGTIGEPINIRCQYGHGGRAGYEKEWRGNYKLSGGGELTDQGVHLLDLIQWFCGVPAEAYACLQTAFWPIKPSEDNGFALLKYSNGLVANFHSSWTQWKNLFNFEIFGKKGALAVNGIGGSYGPETLTVTLRKPEGGAPDVTGEVFAGEDMSWKSEWEDFLNGMIRGKRFLGTAEEGFLVMRTLESLYESHKMNKPVKLGKVNI